MLASSQRRVCFVSEMDISLLKSPAVLVADLNGARRDMVFRAFAARPGIRVHSASTLSETFRLIEELVPQRVVIAEEIAQMKEFEMLTRVLSMISAKAMIYGSNQQSALSFPVTRVSTPSTVDTLVRAVLSGLAPALRTSVSPRPVPAESNPATPAKLISAADMTRRVIGIGASTGGIVAIEKILRAFPADCPPTLVVQHIRSNFATRFIERIDSIVSPKVCVARDGEELRRGHVYIAADAERHLGVVSRVGLRARLIDAPEVSGHRPSVDVLFNALSQVAKRYNISAALLTGMGADGADGMCALRASGAVTIAQDKATSVVWGMPQVAVQRGGATAVLPIDRIGEALLMTEPARVRENGTLP